MLTTESIENEFDLSNDALEEDEDRATVEPRTAVLQRLEAYRILPPAHDRLPLRVLEHIDQLFATWFELADDASRRAAVSYVFATDADVRAALLAIVPLYYDAMFFDEHTPTRDLIEVALVAHAKWRRWLSGEQQAS